ncbi:SDR family oxidoreductase [Patulibacter sp. NPDC049589]|uniref:SDR family oxidoreductase n=1 Tax=Patulibacter sp. NPDC049589 TaxID=3154731 RepID=UPI0034195D75
MDLGIAGRTAIVGGASAGIGRAIASALIAEGVTVVLSSRDPERTRAAAAAVGAAAGIAWDTADVAGADRLVDAAEAAVGPIDIVIANTGGPPMGPDPLAFDDAQWDDAHRHLVRAPMALLRRTLPGMRERGWGRVVGIASTSVREPLPNLVLSNAERSAALAAFKTMAREVAADGVTINTLLTGRIATKRLASADGSLVAAEVAARDQVPAGRLGRPEEMAAAATFLCSVQAAYITGAALPVDGGLLRGT